MIAPAPKLEPGQVEDPAKTEEIRKLVEARAREQIWAPLRFKSYGYDHSSVKEDGRSITFDRLINVGDTVHRERLGRRLRSGSTTHGSGMPGEEAS